MIALVWLGLGCGPSAPATAALATSDSSLRHAERWWVPRAEQKH